MLYTKVLKWLSVILVIAVIIPIISCGNKENQALTPTATVTTEYPIPSDFYTYNDSTGLFSISYPADWHVASELLPYLHEKLMEYINSSGSSVNVGNAMFSASTNSSLDYRASMNIVIGPLPSNLHDIEELTEAMMQSAKSVPSFGSFDEICRAYTVIDGREAAIIECESEIQGTTTHGLMMITTAGNLIWQVTSVTIPDSFSEHEDDFQAIIHSLRIHY